MTAQSRSAVPSMAALTAIVAVALLGGIKRAAHAGINAWTSNGPEGGNVFALAIDPATPSTLYAGILEAVFKSMKTLDVAPAQPTTGKRHS